MLRRENISSSTVPAHRRGEGHADNPRRLRKPLLDRAVNILASQHLKSHLSGVGGCLLSFFVGTCHPMLGSILLPLE